MMYGQRVGIVLLVLSAIAGGASSGIAAGNRPGTTDLFDGHSLAGWDCFLENASARAGDVWAWRDGILVCKGKPRGYLATKREYADFKLTLEWRWPPGVKPGNGGVLVRMHGPNRIWPRSLEAQINAGAAGDFWGLDGFPLAGPGVRTKSIKHPRFGQLTNVRRTGDAENPAGQWNRYEILADGPVVVLRINGREVNRATTREVRPGRICLTAEGDPIDFRNVRLESIAKRPRRQLAELALAGDWDVRVTLPTAGTDGGRHEERVAATLHVKPSAPVAVVAQRYDQLPLFHAKAAGWTKGVRLQALRASETTTPHLLEPASLIVRAGPGEDSQRFRLGTDYGADTDWGTVGRLAGGRIRAAQPVYISYRYTPLRLDAVVLTADGRIVLQAGVPRAVTPCAPEVQSGARRLANIYLPGPLTKLGPEHLFPVLETAYPEPAKPAVTQAQERLPKTMRRLRTGAPLRILAWGDSVTVGSYLADPAHQRWQEQVVARLRGRFPRAKITLITEAWGGRNTSSYLAEPPGSAHNYREKVLGAKPDLVISEFVNDAGLNPAQVEERYSKILADFRQIGAEWIIFTPHYVRPDWMGLDRERDIDDDPRPYVAGLRAFAAQHHVALAEASRRYGRLWRQGIPYTTLLVNSINHPNPRGMKLFADALMELFP